MAKVVSIPRVIYSIWYSKDGTDADPPARYAKYEASWRQHCPNYEHVLLRTSDIEYMWANEPALQEFRSVYRRMKLIERCDYSRYALMALKGCVYRDQNMMCYRNLDALLADRNIVLVREPSEMEVFRGPKVGNQFLASTAGHHFWLQSMRYMRDNYDKHDAQDSMVELSRTGPVALEKCARLFAPADAFVDTCLLLPYLHAGYMDVQIESRDCAGVPPEKRFAAKIWHETACWGQNQSNCQRSPVRLVIFLVVLAAVVCFAVRRYHYRKY
jgi:hypothetical protein